MTNRKTVNFEPTSPDIEKPDVEDTVGKAAPARKAEVRLGREVQARIGQQLRAMYDDVLKQGVPPNLADLVRRLSEQDDGVA